MMKVINEVHLEGLLYEHALELKTTGEKSKTPGTQYITGTISIATDEDCTNIVPVHFTYVTATTAKGTSNNTFTILNNIINKNYKNCMEHGKDSAVKLRIDSAIALNEFFSERNGTEDLVSAKRNEGGFIHVIDALDADIKKRNLFRADMLITRCTYIEGDEDRQLDPKVTVHGAIFNFRNELLPVDFTVTSKGGMDYYLGLDASNDHPVFTRVWGKQISQTIVKVQTEESAFGEACVKESKSSRRDFVITGGSAETYEWDTEETMTRAELDKAMANREVYLADVKRRQDEYKASKTTTTTAASTPVTAKGGFNF